MRRRKDDDKESEGCYIRGKEAQGVGWEGLWRRSEVYRKEKERKIGGPSLGRKRRRHGCATHPSTPTLSPRRSSIPHVIPPTLRLTVRAWLSLLRSQLFSLFPTSLHASSFKLPTRSPLADCQALRVTLHHHYPPPAITVCSRIHNTPDHSLTHLAIPSPPCPPLAFVPLHTAPTDVNVTDAYTKRSRPEPARSEPEA